MKLMQKGQNGNKKKYGAKLGYDNKQPNLHDIDFITTTYTPPTSKQQNLTTFPNTIQILRQA
jgi:hypothetical protein